MKTKILMGVIFPILVTFIMSIMMSFFMVWINVGFGNITVFFISWGKSTLIGFAVGLPVSLIFLPFLQKFLMKFADDNLVDEKE